MTFAEFFIAIHGVSPFAWQSEAAVRLVDGIPLDVLAVPTAAGKTALLDAAIFAAAGGGRRRIAFVVDRRLVVDEVVERAEFIKVQLANTQNPELAKIAARLGLMQVVRLRGGVHGDDNWVLQHEALTIIVSTVDQIGSRLLFRGYGVSTRMAPVHAGFVGNNLLLVIDEAHLSQPFIETVERLARYGADVKMLLMTATPVTPPQAPLRLGPDDLANPLLQRRINASKTASLQQIAASEQVFVAECVAAAKVLAKVARVVGVVVNRVGTARAIFEKLHKDCASILLIGRCRPFERDRLLGEWMPRIRVGRDRSADQPIFVVATQTIEVGANIDFDALVSESAPLSALRQRFGRLDRLGEIGRTNAAIMHRKSKQVDPIYGEGINSAWEWVSSIAVDGRVDFGIAAMEAAMSGSAPPAEELTRAATLLPSHVELLQQTGPISPEMDIGAFLHGASRPSAEVSVIWRSDLSETSPQDWVEIVSLRPPQSRELIEISLPAFRRWLAGLTTGDTSDLGTVSDQDEQNVARLVLRWRGADQAEVVAATELRSGDTVVIPSSYGGCDDFGWHPESALPVRDIADHCSLETTRGHTVRIRHELLEWAGGERAAVERVAAEYCRLAADAAVDDEIDEEEIARAEVLLRELVASIGHPMLAALGRDYSIETYPGGLALRRSRLEDMGGFITGGKAIPLDQHQAGVARWGERLAPVSAQNAVRDAGAVHDEGKREARFQAMLYGSPVAAAAGPALAKSGLRSRKQLRFAYEASGLPRGFRHELASLAYARPADDLVRHLVATHHGYGRPWFPSCTDPDAKGHELTRVDGGWPKAFLASMARYGPWQLAGLESALRAADARRSIEEQQDD